MTKTLKKIYRERKIYFYVVEELQSDNMSKYNTQIFHCTIFHHRI